MDQAPLYHFILTLWRYTNLIIIIIIIMFENIKLNVVLLAIVFCLFV